MTKIKFLEQLAGVDTTIASFHKCEDCQQSVNILALDKNLVCKSCRDNAWDRLQITKGQLAEAQSNYRDEVHKNQDNQEVINILRNSESSSVKGMKVMLPMIRSTIIELQNKKEKDVHCETCRRVAETFDLWDDEDCFPVWLSRVVEGEMRDLG